MEYKIKGVCLNENDILRVKKFYETELTKEYISENYPLSDNFLEVILDDVMDQKENCLNYDEDALIEEMLNEHNYYAIYKTHDGMGFMYAEHFMRKGNFPTAVGAELNPGEDWSCALIDAMPDTTGVHTREDMLERIFVINNNMPNRPKASEICSLSCGDVIHLHYVYTDEFYFVDDIGFTRLVPFRMVSEAEILDMVSEYCEFGECKSPLGNFYCKNHCGGYTVVYNETGDCFTEDLERLEGMIKISLGKGCKNEESLSLWCRMVPC